jgi:hypothetical protein
MAPIMQSLIPDTLAALDRLDDAPVTHREQVINLVAQACEAQDTPRSAGAIAEAVDQGTLSFLTQGPGELMSVPQTSADWLALTKHPYQRAANENVLKTLRTDFEKLRLADRKRANWLGFSGFAGVMFGMMSGMAGTFSLHSESGLLYGLLFCSMKKQGCFEWLASRHPGEWP